jgi:hypothetical protein
MASSKTSRVFCSFGVATWTISDSAVFVRLVSVPSSWPAFGGTFVSPAAYLCAHSRTAAMAFLRLLGVL